jgi:hypothetical protein
MDIKTIGKWAYLVGLVIAVVTGLVGYYANWLEVLLIVLAVVTGLFFMDTGELTNYGVRYLTLFTVTAALNAIPFVGPYITNVAHAMVGFFGAIILTVLLVFNFNQAVKWFTSD